MKYTEYMVNTVLKGYAEDTPTPELCRLTGLLPFQVHWIARANGVQRSERYKNLLAQERTASDFRSRQMSLFGLEEDKARRAYTQDMSVQSPMSEDGIAALYAGKRYDDVKLKPSKREPIFMPVRRGYTGSLSGCAAAMCAR